MNSKSGIQIYLPGNESKFIELLPCDVDHTYKATEIGKKFFRFYCENSFAKKQRRAEYYLKKGEIAITMHDVGKTNYMDIIAKGEDITEKEIKAIKEGHVFDGFFILADLKMPQDICTTALCHHEDWNGNGYPIGERAKMNGQKIPFYARSTRLIDFVETGVNNNRLCTRSRIINHGTNLSKADKFDAVILEMNENYADYFDPVALDIFNAMMAEHEIRRNVIKDLEAPEKNYFEVHVPEEIMKIGTK